MSATNLQTSSDSEKKAFMDSFDSVLTDCDGVLWIGGQAIPGAAEVMNNFKRMGKQIFYITNNSTLTRVEFLEKFKRLGFDVTEDNIISTAWLAAKYLKDNNFNKKAYIIGPKAIEKELKAVGITSTGVGPDPVNLKKVSGSSVVVEEYGEIECDIGAVIVGYDHHISLPKLVKAATYLSNPNTLFIATNTDETYPHRGKFVWPGTGTFVAAVETCSLRKATIMGKPDTYIVDAILRQSGLDPKRALMIGDRCNTDIYFGTRSKMITLLVLSGVTKLSDLQRYQDEGKSNLIPTFYTESIADILPLQSVG